MHEALITRGQVRGHEYQDKIYSPYNCVLRHQTCPNGKGQHTPGIGSESEYKACVDQIVEFEGMITVAKWLEEMEVYFPTVASQALRRFSSLVTEKRE